MMTPAIFQLPAPVGEVLARLAAAGFDAWCVGGCVRDLSLIHI